MSSRAFLLLMLLFLTLQIATVSCDKVDLENPEQIFVTPAPEFTPGKISENLRKASSAPQLEASHLSEDINLCLSCHPKDKLLTYDVNLIFSHQRHFDQGVVCHTCHHSNGALVYTPVKEDCIACHIDRGVPAACSTCHQDVDILKPESHIKSGFDLAHGRMGLELNSCNECHGTKRFCIDCHGVPMPHSSDYLTIHPSQVHGDPMKCNLCHGTQSCQSCHDSRGVKFD